MIISVHTVVAHIIPQDIASAGPTTTGKSPGQHHRIFTAMDCMIEQIPNTQEYPENMIGVLQIPGQHPPKIQEITVQLINRYTQIIQMYFFLTEIIDMTKIELYTSRSGLTRDTNRQYSPNYNHNHCQPSPPVFVAGPDLSAILIDLANIQSRSLVSCVVTPH